MPHGLSGPRLPIAAPSIMARDYAGLGYEAALALGAGSDVLRYAICGTLTTGRSLEEVNEPLASEARSTV